MRDVSFLTRFAGPVGTNWGVYRPANVAGALGLGSPGMPAWALGIPHAGAVGGPQVQEAQVNGPNDFVPFRRATTGRTGQLATTGPVAVTAAQQLVEVPLDGSGFVYGVHLDVSVVTAANAAAVAYTEDAPFSALASVIFMDVTGETHNLDGYSLYLANAYGGWRTYDENVSVDANIWLLTAGAGATGGSFRFHLLIPVGINERDLIGLLGNEDRAQRYFMRNDIAPSATIYTVAPTNAGNITIARSYRSYTVPAPSNSLGHRQETLPPKFGVIHSITRAVSPSAPAGGATVQHQLPRLGNTIRNLICVFRSNGTRALAEASAPTRLALYIGDVPLFIDTWASIRQRMFEAYGFDADNGVIVYSFLRDFVSPRAGAELMEDYLWTQKVTQAYLEVTYPAGFGAANNSLTFITDDLKVPANVDLYA
jgi:hypothetical protein